MVLNVMRYSFETWCTRTAVARLPLRQPGFLVLLAR